MDSPIKIHVPTSTPLAMFNIALESEAPAGCDDATLYAALKVAAAEAHPLTVLEAKMYIPSWTTFLVALMAAMLAAIADHAATVEVTSTEDAQALRLAVLAAVAAFRHALSFDEIYVSPSLILIELRALAEGPHPRTRLSAAAAAMIAAADTANTGLMDPYDSPYFAGARRDRSQ
jgi:hypothetical protein